MRLIARSAKIFVAELMIATNGLPGPTAGLFDFVTKVQPTKRLIWLFPAEVTPAGNGVFPDTFMVF
jgi:hypothetical protein